jgi:CheY-like chemotaxis protein
VVSSLEVHKKYIQHMSLAVPPYSISTIKRFGHFYDACRLAYLQYRQSGLSDHHPNGLRLSLRDLLPDSSTFVALQDHQVIATVTGVRWSPCRLPASSTFSKEIESLVATGSVVTEGTKFASRAHEFGFPKEKGKLTVVSEDLLKTILYWSSLVGASHWVNVVHPRHLPYFSEKLGFSVLSDSRDCAHVSDHPGVLISIPTADCFPIASAGITSYLKEHYLQQEPNFSRFQNHYRLENHEISFLLLECPELLERATEPERLLFDWYYPRVSEDLIPLLRNHHHTPLRSPSLAPAMSSLLDIPDGATYDIPEVFEPISYLKRLATVATQLSNARGKKINVDFKANGSPPCLNTSTELGISFTSVLAEFLAASTLGTTCSLTVDALVGAGETTEVSLHWTSTGEQTILNRLNEHGLDFTGSIRIHDQSISVHFPILHHAPKAAITLITETKDQRIATRGAILIISSNTLESRVLRIMVSQLGYTPLIADGQAEIMAMWMNNYIICTIVDLASPGTGGFSACRLIRSSGAWGTKVPIIACTGYPLQAVNDACNEAGVTACINKPISLQKLTSLVNELISEHTAPLPLDSESIVVVESSSKQ